jgi:hypothetical protein
VRNAVIALEKRTRRAALAVLVDESALQAVSFEHLPFRVTGHMLSLRFAGTLRSLRLTEALLFELGDQKVQRAISRSFATNFNLKAKAPAMRQQAATSAAFTTSAQLERESIAEAVNK